MTTPTFAQDTEDFLTNPDRAGGSTTTFIDNMKLPVHRWYRYSAGYSAGWAASLIRHWGAQHVLDPFAGSGTTNLAAQEQGGRLRRCGGSPDGGPHCQREVALAVQPR